MEKIMKQVWKELVIEQYLGVSIPNGGVIEPTKDGILVWSINEHGPTELTIDKNGNLWNSKYCFMEAEPPVEIERGNGRKYWNWCMSFFNVPDQETTSPQKVGVVMAALGGEVPEGFKDTHKSEIQKLSAKLRI